MKSQHQAVVDAVVSIKACKTSNLSKQEKQEVVEIVAQEMLDGKVSFSKDAKEKHNTPQLIFAFVSKIVNSWLSKSPILNNETQIHGKKRRSEKITDSKLKILVALQVANSNNTEKYEALGIEIMKRKMELANMAKPKIDVKLLPSHLQHLVK